MLLAGHSDICGSAMFFVCVVKHTDLVTIIPEGSL